MHIILRSLVAGSVFAMMAASPAHAITGQAWEFSTENINFTNNAWNFGARFEARNYSYTHLGYYDDRGDGFAGGQTHLVALYDIAGNLIDSATVNTTDPLVGHWRWARALGGVLNGVYQIHGTSGTDNYTWNTNGFGTDPRITYLGNTWALGATPDFLPFNKDDVADGFWGANLASIPEPQSWAMLIAGFGLTGFAMRRRRAQTSVAA